MYSVSSTNILKNLYKLAISYHIWFFLLVYMCQWKLTIMRTIFKRIQFTMKVFVKQVVHSFSFSLCVDLSRIVKMKRDDDEEWGASNTSINSIQPGEKRLICTSSFNNRKSHHHPRHLQFRLFKRTRVGYIHHYRTWH